MTGVLAPARLGPVELRNRLIRAGTGESMADTAGMVGDEYVALHRALARGGVGLAFTGHMFVHPRGRYGMLQGGIHDDAVIPRLKRVTEAVHREGGRIFAQIAHAGSQSMVPGNEPLAPSAVANVMTGRQVEDATEHEIEEAVAAFAAAAERAMEAGFDGVHIHGANGYLIAEFRSPLTNRRSDAWGGSAGARERFPLEVVKAVRAVVPADKGLTMKLGFLDMVDAPGGLDTPTAVAGAAALVDAGLDGIEVSSNLMSDYVSASIKPYIAVTRRRAAEDLLWHRLLRGPQEEGYFLPFARALRAGTDTSIILVGGLRRLATMQRLIDSGETDFVSLSRPFIRQPDLVRRFEQGEAAKPSCVSCNICLMHDEHHSLRCWRVPRSRLAAHAVYRLKGGFRRGGSGKKPQAGH